MKFKSLRPALVIVGVAAATFAVVTPASSQDVTVAAECVQRDYVFSLPDTMVAAGESYGYSLPQAVSGGDGAGGVTVYGVYIHAWDGYPGRDADAASGPHNEQIIIDFVGASGAVVGSIGPTFELADVGWPIADQKGEYGFVSQLNTSENIESVVVRHANGGTDQSEEQFTELRAVCMDLLWKRGSAITTTTAPVTSTTEATTTTTEPTTTTTEATTTTTEATTTTTEATTTTTEGQVASTTTTTTTTVPTKVLPEVEVADPADPVDGTPAFTG
jgi:hypothetical protein